MNLYTVASGIDVHNKWMGVIGTNISNSGSIGYQKYTFEIADYMYQSNVAGSTGLGAGAWDIRRNTQNGVLIQSANSTHVAISGEGYFKLQNESGTYYSRAGLFDFDSKGVYTDSRGNAVLGIPLNNGVPSGGETKITLPAKTLPAEATTMLSTQLNIGFENEASPSSLFDSWNNGIGQSQYVQEMSFSVYTPTGKKQTVNVYFDRVQHNGSDKLYEYAIAIPPEDDTRTLPEDSTKKGLLMTGVMSFSSGGSLQNMSALVPSHNPEDLSSWKNAPLNSNGFPMFPLTTSSGTQNIAFNVGIRSEQKNYVQNPSTNPLLASMLGEPVKQSYASTAYAGDTLTEFVYTDGSAEGYLQQVSVNQAGIMTAKYSNGRSQDLYQLNLYTFQATDALKDYGNGLYYYDASVGGAIYKNKPGEGNAGLIQGGYLEQSNVDIASEFVSMILCQNSLTANTKMFSTMDNMLKVAITLKD